MENFIKNFRLKGYNTFNLDVRCDYFFEYSSVEELILGVEYCESQALEWMALGGGANVLFGGDFSGVIIRSGMQGVERCGDLVVVDSGVDWDWFVAWAVERGLGGLENLSYIPGSVGAAPIQNIGAYGVEAKDTIAWVEYYDTQNKSLVRLQNSECGFGYRESIFKRELKGKVIITRVAFKLTENPIHFNIEYGDVKELVEQKGGASLQNIREAVTQIRKSKLPEPSELGNAGSFFKNPVVDRQTFLQLQEKYEDLRFFSLPDENYKIPAGWLIEKAGWKGRREGNVGVHQKQALVLVNHGGATAQELVDLAKKIIEDVYLISQIKLEMEVNLIKTK